MSDPIFGAVLGGLGTAAQVWSQQATNQKNEQLMREGWDREDNAVQRRQADMIKAGINPLMAAGSAATSSGPATMQSPVKENAGKDIIEALRGMVSIDQLRAQTDLIKAQQDQTFAGTHKLEAETGNIKQEMEWNKSTQPVRMNQLRETLRKTRSETENLGATTGKTLQDTAWDKSTQGVRRELLHTQAGIQSNQKALGDMQTAWNKMTAADSGGRTNYNYTADIEKARKLAETKTAGWTSNIAEKQMMAIAIAIDKAGIGVQYLKELQKLNPALADGIAKWLGIAQGTVKTAFGNFNE